MTSSDYLLCGLRVRSSFDLPELTDWPGARDAPTDVIISQGEVPLALADAITPGRYLAVAADGTVLVHVVDLARFLIRNGREIIVQLLRPDAAVSARVILLNTVLAYLLHQRGAYPFHAAALRSNDGVVAIAGDRGAGKSTLAHRLLQNGFDLISDDMAVLRDDGDAIRVVPTYPRLKLWRSAMEAAGLSVDPLARVREGVDKFDLNPRARFDVTPAPLKAIVLLAEGETVALSPIPPARAIPAIQSHVMRWRTAISLGRRSTLLQQSAAIASRVPVYRLTRPKRFDMLPASVAVLVRTFGA